MDIEYEIRVLEIDEDEMIAELEKLGAKKVGEWYQKRYVYDTKPKANAQWFRLRTNGESTTLTYKNIEKDTIDGTRELEVVVSDFEKTNDLLKLMGYIPKGYQENKRIRYLLDGVEVDIDSWPMIPSYMEIEGKSEDEVNNTLAKLSIDKNKVTALGCQDIYQQIYNIDLNTITELKF